MCRGATAADVGPAAEHARNSYNQLSSLFDAGRGFRRDAGMRSAARAERAALADELQKAALNATGTDAAPHLWRAVTRMRPGREPSAYGPHNYFFAGPTDPVGIG